MLVELLLAGEKHDDPYEGFVCVFLSYLCSGTCVSEMTMFWSIKMSNARRKPSPNALSVFILDSLSNGGKLKIGPSWTLN